jgi:hypothetical protein
LFQACRPARNDRRTRGPIARRTRGPIARRVQWTCHLPIGSRGVFRRRVLSRPSRCVTPLIVPCSLPANHIHDGDPAWIGGSDNRHRLRTCWLQVRLRLRPILFTRHAHRGAFRHRHIRTVACGTLNDRITRRSSHRALPKIGVARRLYCRRNLRAWLSSSTQCRSSTRRRSCQRSVCLRRIGRLLHALSARSNGCAAFRSYRTCRRRIRLICRAIFRSLAHRGCRNVASRSGFRATLRRGIRQGHLKTASRRAGLRRWWHGRTRAQRC